MSCWNRSWGSAIAAGVFGAILLLLLARAAIQHPVHYDELLHILSARGVLQTGQPVIADGLYVRAELFTRAVAWSFDRFGDDAVIARLPALVAGAILAFVFGVWVVRQAGLLSGVLAVIILCLVPATLDVAVFARFYTVHAVLMLLMFICAFEVTQPGRPVSGRIVIGGLFSLFAFFGWHFQDTTIIAVGAAVMAGLSLLAWDHLQAIREFMQRRPAITFSAVAMVGLLSFGAVWALGLLDQLGKASLWASGNASRLQYYLVEFRKDLPLLWPILPVVTLVALTFRTQRRLALFCSVALASALLVHSVAAQKLLRYVYYLVPLMCVLWAVGFARLVTLAGDRSDLVTRRDRLGRTTGAFAMFGIAVLLSQEGARALNLLADRKSGAEDRPFAMEPDWGSLVPELEGLVRAADLVVTSNSMKALFFLGRYDYELNATIVPETESQSEFGRDRRTGRQVIGTAHSIRKVLAQPGSTLVVIESSKIGRSSGVNQEAFAAIASRCDEKELPPDSGVRAWWCVAAPP